ncbi:MAG: RING finger domain-containing protein [Candidatus Colwellbacteria bacterium]|nr:RING finger domain-containing protein [Candidatus Colwellbacteria bacterium]
MASLFSSMRPNTMFNPLNIVRPMVPLSSGRIPLESVGRALVPPVVHSGASSSRGESKDQYELKEDNVSPPDYIRSDQYVDYKKLCDDNLECSICLNIIDGTVAITTCMHRFCSSCLFEYMMKKVGSASCPNCRASIDNPEDVMISSELSDILDSSVIRCKNKECTAELPRKEYKKHTQICEFNKKQCKGCKSLYFEKDFESHMEECLYRVVKCNLCNSYTKVKDQKTHRDDVCPGTMIKCPNQKCNYMTQRSKINRHNASCTYRMVTCSNGCESIFDHKEQSLHNEICNLRPVMCEFCENNVPYSKLIDHYRLCPKKPAECKWCKSTIVFGDMSIHEMNCLKKIVKCPLGCGIDIERMETVNHTSICSNRYVKCSDCSQQYMLSRKDYHESLCSETVVKCPDCSQKITRKNIYFHSQSNCEMKIVECKYVYAGCSCKFTRKTESEHYREYKDLHLEILDKYIQEKVHVSLSRPRNRFEDMPASYFALVSQPAASPILSRPPPRVENRSFVDAANEYIARDEALHASHQRQMDALNQAESDDENDEEYEHGHDSGERWG